MSQKKSFYDYNLDSQQERQQRNKRFPALAKFHIALREELTEAEYLAFFAAEKESIKQFTIPKRTLHRTWAPA